MGADAVGEEARSGVGGVRFRVLPTPPFPRSPSKREIGGKFRALNCLETKRSPVSLRLTPPLSSFGGRFKWKSPMNSLGSTLGSGTNRYGPETHAARAAAAKRFAAWVGSREGLRLLGPRPYASPVAREAPSLRRRTGHHWDRPLELLPLFDAPGYAPFPKNRAESATAVVPCIVVTEGGPKGKGPSGAPVVVAHGPPPRLRECTGRAGTALGGPPLPSPRSVAHRFARRRSLAPAAATLMVGSELLNTFLSNRRFVLRRWTRSFSIVYRDTCRNVSQERLRSGVHAKRRDSSPKLDPTSKVRLKFYIRTPVLNCGLFTFGSTSRTCLLRWTSRLKMRYEVSLQWRSFGKD